MKRRILIEKADPDGPEAGENWWVIVNSLLGKTYITNAPVTHDHAERIVERELRENADTTT